MTKPRSDSLLARLTDEQREALATWLLGGLGYESAVVRCSSEWGIATSVGALSNFWAVECQPRLIARRSRAAAAATAIAEASSGDTGQLDAALRATIKQRAFEVLIDPSADPTAISQIVSQAVALSRIQAQEEDRRLKERALGAQQNAKERELEIRHGQLQLDRERYERETCELILKAAGDARVRDIETSGAPREEKIARLRQIYFADVDALQAAEQSSTTSGGAA